MGEGTVVVSENAGGALTSGSWNVALGYNAGDLIEGGNTQLLELVLTLTLLAVLIELLLVDQQLQQQIILHKLEQPQEIRNNTLIVGDGTNATVTAQGFTGSEIKTSYCSSK